MNSTANNISTTSRVIRISAGLALAIGVGVTSGSLGAAAILPLVAIYPLMTGTLGWDPVVAAYNSVKESSNAAVVNDHVHAA